MYSITTIELAHDLHDSHDHKLYRKLHSAHVQSLITQGEEGTCLLFVLGENSPQSSILESVYLLPAGTKTRCLLAKCKLVSLKFDHLLPAE